MSEAQLKFTNIDGLVENSQPAIVVLMIGRDHIETGNIAEALTSLHVLADSPESAALYRECLSIVVDGYNEDPRAIWEIPEVRDYFARLTNEWPHWTWFMARGCGDLQRLFYLLCDVETQHKDNRFYVRFSDLGQVCATLEGFIERGHALFDFYKISIKDRMASTNSAVMEICGPLQ